MKKYLLTYLLITTTFPLISQENDTYITIGHHYTLHSQTLNEPRPYLLHLPASYENDHFYINKKYPVLILLDGDRLFPLVTGMVQQMSSGGTEQVPEMIIVGVSNTDRNRDMLPQYTGENNLTDNGGAPLFLQFLEKELIPEIEKNYRANNCRILVGHSHAGVFTVNSFINKSTFNGYLSIDPNLRLNEETILKKSKVAFNKTKKHVSNIYIAQANNPFNEMAELNGTTKNFHAFLKEKNMEDLRFQFAYFKNEDHYSIPTIALYDGLRFIFDGYKFPLNKIAEADVDEIKKHYRKISDQFGGELLPPGKLLNQVGLFLLQSENKMAGAIKILELNKTYYPNSPIPYNSLGDACRNNGNDEAAIENYEKALLTDPSNEHARAALEEIKNN